MRRQLVLLVVLVLALGVLLAAPVSGQGHSDLQDRPFKATADRVAAGPSDMCPPGYLVAEDSTYTGTGTHLGRFELYETLCLDPFLGGFFVDGKLVAANDDELYFRVDGTFPPLESSGWVFQGGTGRFASAEGVAHETLIRDDGGAIIGVEAVGTIRFDASDRSS